MSWNVDTIILKTNITDAFVGLVLGSRVYFEIIVTNNKHIYFLNLMFEGEMILIWINAKISTTLLK